MIIIELTPLYYGCYKSYKEIIEYLVKNGANVNVSDNYRINSTSLCVQRGHIEIIEYLVEHGANVNVSNNYGITPLHYACFERSQMKLSNI